MQGYKIADLREDVRLTIKQQHLDKNGDGRINEENGELAALLSKTGSSDIQELAGRDTANDLMNLFMIGGTAGASAIMGMTANKGFETANRPLTKKEIAVGVKTEQLINPKLTKAEAELTFINSMREGRRQGKFYSKFCFAASLGLAALSTILMLSSSGKNKKLKLEGEQTPEKIQQKPVENNDLKQKFVEGYKNIGIAEDTPVKEYVPNKGEYWTAIIKAKYGVDDKTALEMTHAIKQAIYDDTNAAKQPPVMYLPETWNFKGKTYHYSDSHAQIETSTQSGNVKTEMGKMNKDIKYE